MHPCHKVGKVPMWNHQLSLTLETWTLSFSILFASAVHLRTLNSLEKEDGRRLRKGTTARRKKEGVV